MTQPLGALASGVLTAHESKAFLAKHGIPTTASALARTAEDSVRAAERIGYPVALKIESPDISHKTEADGVRLGLARAEDVRRAFAEVVQSSRTRNPAAQIDGVSVEQYLRGGVEVIVGLKRDEVFGPVLLFGIGGIFVEALEDVSVRVLPLLERDIRELIGEVKAHRILEGFRGAERSDVDSLIRLMSQVAALGSSDDRILELDLNPILVRPAPHGAVVLDARIRVR